MYYKFTTKNLIDFDRLIVCLFCFIVLNLLYCFNFCFFWLRKFDIQDLILRKRFVLCMYIFLFANTFFISIIMINFVWPFTYKCTYDFVKYLNFRSFIQTKIWLLYSWKNWKKTIFENLPVIKARFLFSGSIFDDKNQIIFQLWIVLMLKKSPVYISKKITSTH